MAWAGNEDTLSWISEMSRWDKKIKGEDIHCVVILIDNVPESLLSSNQKKAFEYMNENIDRLLYYVRWRGDAKLLSESARG